MQESDRTLGSDGTIGASGDQSTLQPHATLRPDATLQPHSEGEEVTTLEPGTMLAGRYQIISTLGVGGMGAVYKAFDRQLTRVVALKTILPEMAATPTALKRFKRELLSAQQIIHKNVVRIFDIGEDGPTKFITMDFIEGTDLKSMIVKRGKIPPAEAVTLIRQVSQGLEAAHAAGVVHRDLKPQNIMVQNDGTVVVMDFGIAQSGEARAVTQTGAFLGTPDYMSPEQARTEQVDARSDIFSLGLIFYEMLTGKLAFQGKTMLETMFNRTKERAVPPAEIDRNVPKGANDIVVKCLELEREKRYQSVTEFLVDLETFDPSKKLSVADVAKARLQKAARHKNIAIVAALLVLAVVAGFLLRNRFAPPQPPQTATHAPMTVLVADISNHTGEEIFDGALEPVVKMALEGAGFITAYDRTTVRSLGLPAITGKLDEQAARQIALNQGLSAVVTGSLDKQGNNYTLSMKATQAVTGEVISLTEDTASKKDQVLFATTKLASTVRKALGDDTSESAVRFAMETLSARSLEAVHEYAVAMDLLAKAKHEDAIRGFSKAADIDPKFGIVYVAMAGASRNFGQQQDAEKYIQQALGQIDNMTEREKLRTRGLYYAIFADPNKCVEEYSTLINRFPADAAAHNNLAFCLVQLRNMSKALDEQRQAAAILPKRAQYRFNVSLYATYSGDFQAGEKEARALLDMDSSYINGNSALAWAQMGLGQLTEAAESFKKLEKLGKNGASDVVIGLADIALYEGRFNEAAQLLEKGAADDLASKYSDRAAYKYATLAYTRLSQGNSAAAVAAAEKALTASKTDKIRFLSGRIFAAAGKTPRAQELSASLATELQAEPRAYAKILEGDIALARRNSRAAIDAFTAANTLLDTWIGRFDLGRAYLEAGGFTEADSEFDRCLRRRGEAISLFNDEVTYGYFPMLYYYLGRAREGQKSQGFAESYRTYLSIREKAGEDPLLAEVRKRVNP